MDNDSDSEDSSFDMAFKYDMSSSRLKYSGNANDDLDSFISRFKDYSVLRDYNAAKSVLALNSVIDGHARVFLDTIPTSEKDSIAKIQALLKSNFEGASWRWAVESQLLIRRQHSSESLDSYASDIMLWCKQIKKSDAELSSIFIRGLLPAIRAFVLSKEPESFRNALDAARLAVAVQRTTEESVPSLPSVNPNSQPSASTNAIHTTLESITGLVANISNRLDKLEHKPVGNPVPRVNYNPDPRVNHNPDPNTNYQRSNQRPIRTVVCWRCGYSGHKWMRCYAKKGIDGKQLN
jgi:hypothetical protein